MEKEEKSEYYDAIYANSEMYARDGQQATHAKIWRYIILNHLNEDAKILDLGSGTGQFGQILIEENFDYKLGIDFSETGIEISKNRFEEKAIKDKFIVGDIKDSNLFKDIDYNTVICTEVLEHITEDLEIIQSLKKGSAFYGTVPNFGGKAHVRHFLNETEVLKRYSQVLNVSEIKPFIGKHIIFLIVGTVK